MVDPSGRRKECSRDKDILVHTPETVNQLSSLVLLEKLATTFPAIALLAVLLALYLCARHRKRTRFSRKHTPGSSRNFCTATLVLHHTGCCPSATGRYSPDIT